MPFVVGKVKAQAIGLTSETLLGNMGAQSLAQRLMQQVRCRMMLPVARTPRVVNIELHRVSDSQCAGFDFTHMNDHFAHTFLSACDLESPSARRLDHTVIAGLAARLGVECRGDMSEALSRL